MQRGLEEVDGRGVADFEAVLLVVLHKALAEGAAAAVQQPHAVHLVAVDLQRRVRASELRLPEKR